MKPMMRKLLNFLIPVLLVLLSSTPARAVITIEITEGVEGAIPVAVVGFDMSRLPVPLKTDIASIITSDLNRSGLFKVLPESDYPQRPAQSRQVQYPLWKSMGAEFLVIGRVLPKEGGRYDVQFQFLDVLKQKQLLGYRFPVRGRNLRSTAHEISDLIYEKITGTRGAFNTRIAYISVVGQGADRKYVLQVADTDGYNPQTILESDEPLMSPAWSPDGASLAYVSFENSRPEIFIQHLASARRSKMAGFKGLNNAPSWSPDGSKLALVLSKDGSPDIYIMDIATRKLRRITRHRAIDTEPVFTPDGKALIFTSDRSGSPQLYRVELAGGKPRRLTFEGPYNAAPDISSDGKRLALLYGEQGRYRIAELGIEDGELSLLTENRLDESPSFAPNGRMVLYATTRGDKGVLYMVSLDGRVQHKLSDQAGDIREPAWGPYKPLRIQ
jgi:TolB protein